MRLAILETGAPPPGLEERFGRYPEMFEALLACTAGIAEGLQSTG